MIAHTGRFLLLHGTHGRCEQVPTGGYLVAQTASRPGGLYAEPCGEGVAEPLVLGEGSLGPPQKA